MKDSSLDGMLSADATTDRRLTQRPRPVMHDTSHWLMHVCRVVTSSGRHVALHHLCASHLTRPGP